MIDGEKLNTLLKIPIRGGLIKTVFDKNNETDFSI